MKPTLLIALAATGALAACSPKASNNTTAQGNAASPSTGPAATNMASTGKSSDAKMGKGTGTVTAVDSAAGTVTLQHGAIPEVGWPAMTMTFKAAPAIVSQVKAGQKVGFEVKTDGGSAEITDVRPQ